MAKSNDYPVNKSIRSRLQCLIESHANMQGMLSIMASLHDDGALRLPVSVRQQISTAIAKAEIASRAVAGDDQ